MINFEHNKTLIVGFDTARGSDWTIRTKHEVQPGDTVLRPSILSIEWLCPVCGASGAGFPPEHHASGACKSVRSLPPGFMDGGGI